MRRWWGGRKWAALAATVFVAGCRSAFISPSASPSIAPSIHEPSGSSASSIETASSTPLPTFPAIGDPPPPTTAWQLIEIAPEGQVRDLISTPAGGLLAVGDAGWNGAVWLSADGRKWTAATDIPPVDSDTARGLTGVTYAAGRYVAWGGQGGRYSEGSQGVIWTSSNGSKWIQVAVVPGFLLDLVPGGPGFVAVGARSGTFNYLNGAVAWSSVDGISWNESPAVPGPDGAAMLDVTEYAGAFVAVGTAGSQPEPIQAVSWRSDDGIAWQQLPLSRDLAGASFFDVVVDSGRLVATGSINVYPPGGLTRPAIWVSDDGANWTESFSGDCCGDFTEIVSSDGRLMAIFRWDVPDEGGGTAVARATDTGGWLVLGTPQIGTDVVWQGLVRTQQGLFGLAYQYVGAESNRPVLLLPPDGF